MIYEINYLVLQSKTAELEKIRKESKEFIESHGAKVVEEKEYLKRKLAYEIKHENYGFFTVLRFEFKGAKNLDELKVKLNQNTDISRYIIVQAEGLSSLKEQDAKELEKTQEERKSIKSEDVEKVLTEQKKAEAAKKEVKVEKKEAPVAVKEEREEEIVEEVEKKEEIVEEKPKKKTVAKKTKAVIEKKKVEKVKEVKKETTQENDKEAEGKEAKEEVSLDELDKKLDEILNS